MKSLISLLISTVVLLVACASEAADFRITAGSGWNFQATTFPGQIYRRAHSKTDEIILIQKRKNLGTLNFDEMNRNSDLVEAARREYLSKFGLSGSSLNSLGLVRLPHARGFDVVVLESTYTSVSGHQIQLVERHYYAGEFIYSVIYSQVAPVLGDRAGIALLMDQFVPELREHRKPANETVGEKGNSKLGLRPAVADDNFQNIELRKPGVCDHIDLALRKSDTDPTTFSFDGVKAWGGRCFTGLKESLPALAHSLAETGALIGNVAVKTVKGAWFYANNPKQLATDAYAAPAVAIEAIRNADQLAKRAITNIAAAISNGTTDFACLKTDLQVKAICKFVAMTAEGAVLGVAAFRLATLTGEAAGQVAGYAVRAVKEVIDANREMKSSLKALQKVEAPVSAPPPVVPPVPRPAPPAPVAAAPATAGEELAKKSLEHIQKVGTAEAQAAHKTMREKFAKTPEVVKILDQLDLSNNGASSTLMARILASFRVKQADFEEILLAGARDKLPIAEIEKRLLAFEAEKKTKFVTELLKTSVTDQDVIRAARILGPEAANGVEKLMKNGGITLRDDLALMVRNERFDDVFKLGAEYEARGAGKVGAIAEFRARAEAVRSEISAAKAKGIIGRRPQTIEQVKTVRDIETSGFNGLKTFRHSAEDVAAVRKSFPVFNRTLDDFAERLKGTRLKPAVRRADDIPNLHSKTRKRLGQTDPVVKKTMVGIWNRMNDSQALARYSKALAEDAAVEMVKSGTKREIEALTRGELTRNAVMKVLVKRHQAQGNDKFSTITGVGNFIKAGDRPSSFTRKAGTNEGFREAVGQGPFFDKPFGNSRHGIDTHFLQADYISDVVWNATDKNPRIFWDHLGSKKGIHGWVPLFDAADGTLASPEFFAHQVSKLLKVTD